MIGYIILGVVLCLFVYFANNYLHIDDDNNWLNY